MIEDSSFIINQLDNEFECKAFINILPSIPDVVLLYSLYSRSLQNIENNQGIFSYYFYKALNVKYNEVPCQNEFIRIESIYRECTNNIFNEIHYSFNTGGYKYCNLDFLSKISEIIKKDEKLLQALLKRSEAILNKPDLIFYLYFLTKDISLKDKIKSIISFYVDFDKNIDKFKQRFIDNKIL